MTMMVRAFLWDRVFEVDTSKKTVVMTPNRWLGVVFLPCFASTPAALFWIQSQGTYTLNGAGWIMAIGYSVASFALAGFFLSPSNRHTTIDFDARHIVIGGPFGIGLGLDEPLSNVKFTYAESVRESQGGTVYTGKLRVTSARRTLAIAYLGNRAIGIARELARIGPLACEGDSVDLSQLAKETEHNSRGSTLRLAGMLVLMVVPGILFTWAYGR